MIDDLIEAFQADTSLADVSVEQADANHDVWQLAQLSHLLGGRQSYERSQTGSRQHRFESCCDFALDGVGDGSGELDVRILSDDVLLVFVQQVVEDFLVKKGDALEIVTRARFKTDDLINQSVWLVRQVRDVLLTSNFLLHVSWIIADLKLNRVQGWLLNLLETINSDVYKLFSFLFWDLILKIEPSSFY